MQRRKFVVGMGSLAAGASAVMGTGALSESTMERGFGGRFAGDSAAYVKAIPCDNSGNGNYLNYNGSGQMYLDFGNISESRGNGLNTDSINYFDGIFRIQHANPDYDFEYDLTVTSPNSRLVFFTSGEGGRDTLGSNNTKQLTYRDGFPLPTSKGIGVKLDLTDLGMSAGDSLSDVFGSDSFEVHVDRSRKASGHK
jgi:hypothetical protein